jgi:DNA polymerase-4
MDRVVLHSDMNSFYASVECLYHPELRGKPVAVGGDEAQRHGIILTKTPQAKKYGVKTGEAIWQAKQKCPGLIVVPAHYDLYMRHSRLAHGIYRRYTDLIEPFGLDESWLDVTGSAALFGGGEAIAEEIRSTIKRELGVTVSVGVSWNKIFAKLGSDYKKPDAVTVITRENYREKFWELPASDLLYVGPATTRKLARYGIHTLGQLAQSSPEFLVGLLGKWGSYLWAFANGHDISPVLTDGFESRIKSVGNSMTAYRDIETYDEAWQVLLNLSESVARRLRENGFRARTVELSVRDNELDWFGCQTKLSVPACTTEAIADAAMKLLREKYDFHKPLRALGVRGCDLVGEECGVQLSFDADALRQARWETIENCVDGIRGRFGRDAVKRACLVGADIVGEADPLTHEVHPVGFFGR